MCLFFFFVFFCLNITIILILILISGDVLIVSLMGTRWVNREYTCQIKRLQAGKGKKYIFLPISIN